MLLQRSAGVQMKLPIENVALGVAAPDLLPER
jgi:hypothetical protein